MTANQKLVKSAIKSIEFDNFGQMVIVTQPNEYNPKGSYVMNAAQQDRLLKRVGLPDVHTLKHVIALSNGTSVLTFVAQSNKTGEAWDNGREGAARKSGVYTKDWTQFSNHEIELGFAARMKVAEVFLQIAAQNATQSVRPVVRQTVQASAAPVEGVHSPDAPDTKEEPIV